MDSCKFAAGGFSCIWPQAACTAWRKWHANCPGHSVPTYQPSPTAKAAGRHRRCSQRPVVCICPGFASRCGTAALATRTPQCALTVLLGLFSCPKDRYSTHALCKLALCCSSHGGFLPLSSLRERFHCLASIGLRLLMSTMQ